MQPATPLPILDLQTQETGLSVQGMKCAGCVQAVEQALVQKAGVVSASVNLITGKAAIVYQPQHISPDHLAIALTQLGFPAQVESSVSSDRLAIAPEPESRQAVFARMSQIGLAALLVGLSAIGHLHQFTDLRIPILSSLEFHWGLATLALVGPGWPMIQDGWHSLRRSIANMNTLVSLGALTAYTASCVALGFPQLGWDCFFDAPVMIVGLVLLGRTLEEQARGRATAALKTLINLQPAIARQVSPHDPALSEPISIEQVQPGMLLQVLPGDQFPVDGTVH
ncbi:MAG: cation transporter, partial [Thermosynechococcaceae cyanobacterium]